MNEIKIFTQQFWRYFFFTTNIVTVIFFTLYTPTGFFVQFSIEAVAEESSLVRIIDLS